MEFDKSKVYTALNANELEKGDVIQGGEQVTDELRRFLAKWEAAVCEIRAENKACEDNINITRLCDKLENSMVAYSKGNVEYAHFTI